MVGWKGLAYSFSSVQGPDYLVYGIIMGEDVCSFSCKAENTCYMSMSCLGEGISLLLMSIISEVLTVVVRMHRLDTVLRRDH